jgi:hypothetical protein
VRILVVIVVVCNDCGVSVRLGWLGWAGLGVFYVLLALIPFHCL